MPKTYLNATPNNTNQPVAAGHNPKATRGGASPEGAAKKHGQLAALRVDHALLPPLEIQIKAPLPPIGFQPPPAPIALSEINVTVAKPKAIEPMPTIVEDNAVIIVETAKGTRIMQWANSADKVAAPIDMFPPRVFDETLAQVQERYATQFTALDFGVAKVAAPGNTIMADLAELASGKTLSSYSLHNLAYQIHKAVLACPAARDTIVGTINGAYMVLNHLMRQNSDLISKEARQSTLNQMLLLQQYTAKQSKNGIFKQVGAPNYFAPFMGESRIEARDRYQKEFVAKDFSEFCYIYPEVGEFQKIVAPLVVGKPFGGEILQRISKVIASQLDQHKLKVSKATLEDALLASGVRLAKTAAIAAVMLGVLEELEEDMLKINAHGTGSLLEFSKASIEIGILRDVIKANNPRPNSHLEECYYSRF